MENEHTFSEARAIVDRIAAEWPQADVTLACSGGEWSAAIIVPLPDNKQIAQRTPSVPVSQLADELSAVSDNIRFSLKTHGFDTP